MSKPGFLAVVSRRVEVLYYYDTYNNVKIYPRNISAYPVSTLLDFFFFLVQQQHSRIKISAITNISMRPVPTTESNSIKLTPDELVDSASVVSQVVVPSSFTTTEQ